MTSTTPSPAPRPIGRPRVRPGATRSLALLLAAVLVLLAPAATAGADSPFDYGYTGGSSPIRQMDSVDHWQCQENFDIHHDWLNSAMSQLANQTDLSRHDSSSCGTSTDVVWVKTSNSGVYGRTTCVRHSAWGVCDQFWVMVDQPAHFTDAFAYGASDPGAWYSTNIQLTMRHELGHSAGLHHWTGPLNSAFGTMNSAIVNNGTPGWLAYLAYAGFQVNFINDHV